VARFRRAGRPAPEALKKKQTHLIPESTGRASDDFPESGRFCEALACGCACLRLRGLLLNGGPLGVLLRHRRLDALGKQGVGSRRIRVRSGAGQIDVLLVLQGLAGGAIGRPVLLVLIEVQEPFQHRDQYSKPSRDQLVVRKGQRGEEWNGRSRKNLDDLDPFEHTPGRAAFAIVPIDLVLQAVEDRIRLPVRKHDSRGR
jgi:hypothetical protein